MKGRKAQQGFTRTDLLAIVGVVIGLLIICIPTIKWDRVPERGLRVTCAGNLKQISLALQMYSGDNGGFLPPFNAPGSTNFEPLNTAGLLMDGKVYDCPSASPTFTLCRLSNYRYRGSELKDDNASAAAVTIAYDQSGNHNVRTNSLGYDVHDPNCWMNALFLDGHVEGAKPDGSKGWNRND